jgi:signal peptidase I
LLRNISKLTLGARLYDVIYFEVRKPVDITRVWGFRRIKHNDVLVFNFPYNLNKRKITFNPDVYYIKRCIAVAGDTLQIRDGFYSIVGRNETLGVFEYPRFLSKKTEEDFSSDVFRIFPKNNPFNY